MVTLYLARDELALQISNRPFEWRAKDKEWLSTGLDDADCWLHMLPKSAFPEVLVNQTCSLVVAIGVVTTGGSQVRKRRPKPKE